MKGYTYKLDLMVHSREEIVLVISEVTRVKKVCVNQLIDCMELKVIKLMSIYTVHIYIGLSYSPPYNQNYF